MTEDQVQEAARKLSARYNGELRSLFYTKRGLPRQKLYTKDQIFERLGIPEPDNTFEQQGISNRWHMAMSVIRKEAKDHGLGFIDFTIETSEGRNIVYHGFSDDIDKLLQTIELYKQRSNAASYRAKITENAAQQAIALIEGTSQRDLQLN